MGGYDGVDDGRGKYSPVFLELSSLTSKPYGAKLKIDTSNPDYLPDSVAGRSYLFRYHLQFWTTSDLLKDEKTIFPFELELFETEEYYQCTLPTFTYVVG